MLAIIPLLVASLNAQSADNGAELLQQYRARHASCHYDSRKCREACEKSIELESAAESLARCARQRDITDDCGSRARDVRYAADEYETAVADASGYCE